MRVVPFKSNNDIIELKQLFFGSLEDQRRGMEKCKAYQTRGRLPPSVHLTCQLTAAIHADLPSIDLYAIRLTYSMALIRFVNEILDAEQQGKTVVPLYTLAQMADLPSVFVELRHAATHEDLPSIYLLRDMAHRALSFLYDKFWSLQTSGTEPSLINYSEESTVKDLLREWRRIKRNDSKASPPFELIKALQSKWMQNNNEFLEVILTQNVLVPSNTSAANIVVILYLPIFEGIGSDFCSQLVGRLVESMQSREWPPMSSDVREKKQFPMFQAWAEALAKYSNTETVNKLKSTARPWNASVLARYACATGSISLYETAKEMADFTSCTNIPEFVSGWKKVPAWTPRPLGVYM